MERHDGKGTSLAKGPVGVMGVALLAFGLVALLGGANGFDARAMGGNVDGETVLGLEVNGWSAVLFAAAGALLVFAAPLHWGAKGTSLLVGLVLGAASVIALFDQRDVFGIFAANGWTALAWGVAAAVLLLTSLLPRKGRAGERSGARPAERGRRTMVTPVTGTGGIPERRER